MPDNGVQRVHEGRIRDGKAEQERYHDVGSVSVRGAQVRFIDVAGRAVDEIASEVIDVAPSVRRQTAAD
ncbi:hypothetical protein AB0B66_40420 [Catellatospora sp. NPDC049111]|uniref:hypothetical protein n=1 Tax=Catellatospora sp. NPDC049111 TaxID=3155271 RepID=UPI0033FFB69A